MSSEIVEIGDKLRNATVLLNDIIQYYNTAEQQQEGNWLLQVFQSTNDLVMNWEKEWKKHVIDTELQLGSITSYAGSVFNPQEISVSSMTLCVINDMEMFLKEIKALLIKDTTSANNEQEIISKLVCVLATFQFINQSWSNGVVAKLLEDNGFPFVKLNTTGQSITQLIPNYDKILASIGM